MRRAEELAVADGKDWFGLMQSAGNAVAEVICQRCAPNGKEVLVLCSKGNNGGDGFVAAKALSEKGALVTVLLTHGLPATDSAKKAFALLPKEVRITELLPATSYDVVIDAVFGTGFLGQPDEQTQNLFKTLKASDFAIDIPSGLVCDTGEGAEFALPAKHTVTFGALKLCHILPSSSSLCGEVILADIGITEENFAEAGAGIKVIEKPNIPKRDKNSYKNTFGTALSVTGSYGMPGAGIIAGRAAVRTGLGILKMACLPENYTACAVSIPEAVLVPCKNSSEAYSTEDISTLKGALKGVSALLVGPGLGIFEGCRQVVKELLLSSRVPTVLDADGINLIADSIELLKDVKAPLVLTPHPGEMARLLGVSVAEVEKDRINIARSFALEYGVYLVLKGANTLVCTPSGELSVNVIGNPGMATAGSGDMLAGVILALLARGISPAAAAEGGVWLHSAAGDAALRRLGENAMTPTDMTEELCRFI
jgi:NAD(P)H-hydrate epimerase